MKAKAEIDAGVCGFKTIVVATCDDEQYVKFEINSGCEKEITPSLYLPDARCVTSPPPWLVHPLYHRKLHHNQIHSHPLLMLSCRYPGSGGKKKASKQAIV